MAATRCTTGMRPSTRYRWGLAARLAIWGGEDVESAGRVLPRFSPSSPYLRFEADQPPPSGRSHDNVNWACGRCHVGSRPQFAAGMSTWNSVEYSDAMRGGCYSQLNCVTCHNPHRKIGSRWSPSADEDDVIVDDAIRNTNRRTNVCSIRIILSAATAPVV